MPPQSPASSACLTCWCHASPASRRRSAACSPTCATTSCAPCTSRWKTWTRAAADRILADQAAEGRALLAEEGATVTAVEVEHEADLFYRGQSHVFRVPVGDGGFDAATVRDAFAELYRERFDIVLPEMQPILVNLRTTVRGIRPPLDLTLAPEDGEATLKAALIETRPVYFDGAWAETPIYRREALPGDAVIAGPAVIQQLDTTILVEPGSEARADALGNLVLTVPRAAEEAERRPSAISTRSPLR